MVSKVFPLVNVN